MIFLYALTFLFQSGSSLPSHVTKKDSHETLPDESLSASVYALGEQSPLDLSDAQISEFLRQAHPEPGELFRVLQEVRERGPALFVQEVEPYLSDESYQIRLQALSVFEASEKKSLGPMVLERLDDRDPLVRKRSAEVLRKLGSKKMVPYLKSRYFKEENRDVKFALKTTIETLSGLPFQDG